MTIEQILKQRDQGEATMAQFKERIADKYDVACELVAMSNSKGGLLVVGVNDKSGNLNPLSYQEVQETTEGEYLRKKQQEILTLKNHFRNKTNSIYL